MIDDKKKIEEAARRYSEVTDCDKEEALLIEEGFKEGAKWAINEFLKNLWHPISEEPDVRHKTIICLYWDGDIRQEDDVFDEAITHDTHLGIGKFNWNDYAENEEIEKWCYKNDLLPKEGGEQ